jgi:hypothetical protein
MDKIQKSPEQGKAIDQSVSNLVRRRSSKSSFSRVNEKYEHLLASQVVKKDVELKRLVINECIECVSGISSVEYQKTLRDAMTQRLLFHFPFLKECRHLGLPPFEAAQNVVMLNKANRVLKEGLENVFKRITDTLKESVFAESELAKAKYDTPASNATPEQESELSVFIEKAMSILPVE